MAQKAHANALVADLSKDQIRVASISPARKFFSSAPLKAPAQAGRPMWWWWCAARRKISPCAGKTRGRHLGQCRSAHAWTLARILCRRQHARAGRYCARVGTRQAPDRTRIFALFTAQPNAGSRARTLARAISRFIMTVLCASKADKIFIQSTRTA